MTTEREKAERIGQDKRRRRNVPELQRLIARIAKRERAEEKWRRASAPEGATDG